MRAVVEFDREEWVKLNTCKFCVGSHLHSCTGYDCREAVKKAEEYFEKTVRRNDMRLIRCDFCGKEIPWEKGSKLTIEYPHCMFGNSDRSMTTIDLCDKCTKEVEEKVRKNREIIETEGSSETGIRAGVQIIDEMHEYTEKREEQDNG